MNKKYVIGVVVILISYIAYYLISPVFTEIHLDEEAPSEVASNESKETLVDTVENTEVVDTAKFSNVLGTSGHPSSGAARILKTNEGDVLRYENFKTINGPDLFVYLSKDLEATEFVNLGELKATEGNVNYSIPSGVNVSEYPYALVWCKQFGVLFNYADLHAVGL